MKENSQQLKNKVIGGLFWKFAERMSAQLVSLVVSVVLARLLLPDDYGVVSLVTIFITLANVFVTNGFSSSLIQKDDADDIDFSTVFYFNIVFSVVVYGMIFLAAPLLAMFYDMPILTQVIRVLGLQIIIAGVNSIQQAYVSRKMIFRKFFFATIIGTVISAVVGITMAYAGFGVWALVWQYLINSLIGMVVLWIIVDWRPIWAFSLSRLKGMFSYGWKLLVQSLLVTLYGDLRSLVIGKMYTSSDLAFYNKGGQFPNLIVTNIDTAMNSTLFPAMSQEQHNLERMRAIASRTTKLSSYIMSPLLIGFAACATSFVDAVLTAKWLPCVPFLQIICLNLLCRPAQAACLQAIKAAGRSDIVLKMDIPVRVFGVVTLIVALQFGLMYIAITELMVGIFGLILYSLTCGKYVGYNLKHVLKDCGMNVILSVLMGACVWGVDQLTNIGSLLTLLVQILTGVVIYIMLSVVTKNENYRYLRNEIKHVVDKIRKRSSVDKESKKEK